jgi:cytochrome c
MRTALLASIVLMTSDALAAGDTKRGAQLFRQCMACHSVAEGEHLTGPSLAHVTWNEATLDKWLANPEAFIQGTSMTFPGIKQRKDREDVIAYLRAVAEDKAPAAAKGGGGGMMGMQREKHDLRRAPPEGLVKAIRYCGDTYTLETADGKSQKVWEFNLRFKSDSTKAGPAPGKPVVIGAGMRGDRASVVFASPKEISEFIRASCP